MLESRPSIIYFEEVEDGLTIQLVGGPHDGEQFKQVKCFTSQKEILFLWKSSVRKGFYRQTFIPWDEKLLNEIPGL